MIFIYLFLGTNIFHEKYQIDLILILNFFTTSPPIYFHMGVKTRANVDSRTTTKYRNFSLFFLILKIIAVITATLRGSI